MEITDHVLCAHQDVWTRQKYHWLLLGENLLRAASCCSISRSISASHAVAGRICDGFQRCDPPLDSQTFVSAVGSASELTRPSRHASYSFVCNMRSSKERNSSGTTCTRMPNCLKSS